PELFLPTGSPFSSTTCPCACPPASASSTANPARRGGRPVVVAAGGAGAGAGAAAGVRLLLASQLGSVGRAAVGGVVSVSSSAAAPAPSACRALTPLVAGAAAAAVVVVAVSAGGIGELPGKIVCDFFAMASEPLLNAAAAGLLLLLLLLVLPLLCLRFAMASPRAAGFRGASATPPRWYRQGPTTPSSLPTDGARSAAAAAACTDGEPAEGRDIRFFPRNQAENHFLFAIRELGAAAEPAAASSDPNPSKRVMSRLCRRSTKAGPEEGSIVRSLMAIGPLARGAAALADGSAMLKGDDGPRSCCQLRDRLRRIGRCGFFDGGSEDFRAEEVSSFARGVAMTTATAGAVNAPLTSIVKLKC
ncbi:unnamed protein product, partial [Ectocarpus fasciculatus]